MDARARSSSRYGEGMRCITKAINRAGTHLSADRDAIRARSAANTFLTRACCWCFATPVSASAPGPTTMARMALPLRIRDISSDLQMSKTTELLRRPAEFQRPRVEVQPARVVSCVTFVEHEGSRRVERYFGCSFCEGLKREGQRGAQTDNGEV